jgi:hypothetical protein
MLGLIDERLELAVGGFFQLLLCLAESAVLPVVYVMSVCISCHALQGY